MISVQEYLRQRARWLLESLSEAPDDSREFVRLHCLAIYGHLNRSTEPLPEISDQLQAACRQVDQATALEFINQAGAGLTQLAELFDQDNIDGERGQEKAIDLFYNLLDALVIAEDVNDDSARQAGRELFNKAMEDPAILASAGGYAQAFSETYAAGSDLPRLLCSAISQSSRELEQSITEVIRDYADDELHPLSWYVQRPVEVRMQMAAESISGKLSLQQLADSLQRVSWWYVRGSMVCLALKVIPLNQVLSIEVRQHEDEESDFSPDLEGWQVRLRTANIELSPQVVTISNSQAALPLDFEVDPTAFRIEFRKPDGDQWIECYGSST